MFELLRGPWPWYVVGPLIGAMVPLLLVGGNRQFGVSNSLRTLCAATIPAGIEYFKYDWKRHGAWNLAFVAGILTGGLISGISGLVPAALISWEALTTWKGALLIAGGGFAIGFGTAWGGGCSSGHAISGLADLQPASAIAVVSFFAGGLLATWVILPRLFA
jgi:uncharacterized membrane protein YedE/YeeE